LARGHAEYDRAVRESTTSFEELLETLKQAAAALREADVRFMLGGTVPNPHPPRGARA
jgi:hypothetical protein